jgi:hypothetical protein
MNDESENGLELSVQDLPRYRDESSLSTRQKLRDNLWISLIFTGIFAMLAVIASAGYVAIETRSTSAKLLTAQNNLAKATAANHALGVKNHALATNSAKTNKALGVVDGIIVGYVADVNSSLASICGRVSATCVIRFQPTLLQVEKALAGLEKLTGSTGVVGSP